ncbi:penicillin-binding transpeptidase domain-containing protein [Chlamydia avium]|uniref:Penicillin binding transpeptidase domain protein n=1 Tax=Chlamydia avium TaxID=1457141 RepID=A0ABP2X962_9CHLA|nr:penicillin-binding transpeptidase domain-containing protein [Chlamydia avium]EPP36274.1 penicillin binding transpeptidase domain protein [Chlamydia psittaci 10_743_SC13]EPP38507.1 penicillin binding transpeptidase domain protein [Chlamydia avium]
MKYQKKRRSHLAVLEKTNRMLLGIIIVFAVIAVRLWHLAVVEHDQKLEEAYKPQIRVIPELVERATICDRFGKVLAENRMQYDVSVAYGAIQDLPSRAWHLNAQGERELVFVRKNYISRLAELLAEELHLDKETIEDNIHARASVLGSIPYLVQSNVPERTYLKLKMIAKHWPGLHVQPSMHRYYPFGKMAADILGYVGPISAQEYKRVMHELSRLRECVRAYEEGENPSFPDGLASIDQVRSLLHSLESNAYDLNALVGKLGIESSWDGQLRGQLGKKTVLVDRRGNFIQELQNVSTVSGKKLQLTLSAELQAFADSLLVEHERMESFRSAQSLKKQKFLPPLFPWIKGGAIIALDPNNGQVLAMASSPRYDGNDFVHMRINSEAVEERSSVYRWLENTDHISELYDRKVPLKRERKHPFTGEYYDEELLLTFDYFLDFIFPDISEVKVVIKQLGTLGNAVRLQQCISQLLQYFSYSQGCCSCSSVFDAVFPSEEGHHLIGKVISMKEQQWIVHCSQKYQQEIAEIKEKLMEFFSGLSANYDKILLLDLFQLVIDPVRVHPELLTSFDSLSLSTFFDLQGHYIALRSAFSKIMESTFVEVDFKNWRKQSFAKFLEIKRKQEKERKQRYPTPYVDYLLEERRAQYQDFRCCYLDKFLVYLFSDADKEDRLKPYYEVISIWKQELESGAHKALPWYEHYLFLRQHLSYFSSHLLHLFLSFREFSELQRPLYGDYPLMITRNMPQKEQDLAAAFYPAYGYGYLRSHSFAQAATLGSIFKLVSAYSVLSQEVLQGHENIDYLSKLLVILDRQSYGYSSSKPHVGFFKNGAPIPVFYRGGVLPKNDYVGRGHIDLLSALEMSSNPYFSLLVGDYLSDPEDLCHAAALFGFGEKTGIGLPGEYPGVIPQDVSYNRSGLYATAIGQHTLVVTPLQTAVMLASLVNGGVLYVPNLVLGTWEGDSFSSVLSKQKRIVFMPEVISELFKLGMRNVIWGNYGTTRSIRSQFSPELLSRIIGKTSTAESIVRVGLDRQYGSMKMKHVWFAAVGFADTELTQPDIVVIVYLRLGEFGRDAAPMAVKMIDMWDKIKKRESCCKNS